jgi:kinesin family protein 1
MFKQLWGSIRVVHSTVGMFSVAVRPVSAKRAADLWRMNTVADYVKGEELLTTWSARKVSLVRDYIQARKRRQRITEIEAARGVFSAGSLTPQPTSGWSTPSKGADNSVRREILRKYLDLWAVKRDPTEVILVSDHTEPPSRGAAFATGSAPPTPAKTSSGDTESTQSSVEQSQPRFIAAVQHIPKNASVSKSGYLYTPDDTNSRWVRRFVELRLPYLHVYSVPDGDEINAINLRNSHLDHDPDFARLLAGAGTAENMDGLDARGRPNVFAVYGTQNTFLFASRTEVQKVEWILKIDQSYFSSNDRTSPLPRRR